MGNSKTRAKKCEDWLEGRVEAIWENLITNHLWQRMLKNTLATTLAVVLALIPAVVSVYGKAVYLAPITTVFGHPGRRFGMMAEALVLALSGTLVGTAWSMLGIHLSSLVYSQNEPAAYTIKGIFLVIALLIHGYLRSHTPRLFIFVLLLVIVSVVSLTGTAVAVSATLATTLLYPILTAVGILLLVNVLVFPEFSSSFLGITTIETLGETVGALRDAGRYFILVAGPPAPQTHSNTEELAGSQPLTSAETPKEKPNEEGRPSLARRLIKKLALKLKRKPAVPVVEEEEEEKSNSEETSSPEESSPLPTVKLKDLTGSKAKLRAKLESCKAAQTECNFELAFAVLPPQDLKQVSDTSMKKLVANTIALIGACESKYALMGDEQDRDEDDEAKDKDKNQGKLFNGAEQEVSDNGSTGGVESSADESSDDEKASEDKELKKAKKKNKKKGKSKLEREIEDLELVKPRKEIEFGDTELLKYLVGRISKPLCDLQATIDQSVNAITACLAYCYDVPKLPSGAKPPKGIELQEIDIRIDILAEAIIDFDKNSASALEGAAVLHDLHGPQIDIMPRMETFLVSSFLLNLRQAALQTADMLKHSRKLVEKRQARHDRRRIYAPRIKWRKWLTSGGETDMLALPEQGRKDARTGNVKGVQESDTNPADSSETLLRKKTLDEESGPDKLKKEGTPIHPAPKREQKPKKLKKKGSLLHRSRNNLADTIEYIGASEDVLYAVKLTVAVFIVTWPAFLSQWNTWYSLNRGLWAALQLVLITEVAIGTSVMTFLVRAVGTTIGCLWGYAAYTSRDGDPYSLIVMLVIGVIPSTYIQLGSKYVKAGMVSIISICVVALSTEVGTVPGTATENFLKRLIAFLIGGIVALLVEVILFPVRARDRLVESLASSIRHISDMEACIAYGIETGTNVDVHSDAVSTRFDIAKDKAQGALTAAETFLPFCGQEPRLKGSFAGLSLVYTEILYVLHQIVDKMDNMLQLRKEYGSGVLEDLNAQVYPYRRNVAGSITLVLFAIHEALTTKLPLPQFLPSARLAHLRMVNRVREVVLNKNDIANSKTDPDSDIEGHRESIRSHMERSLVKRMVRQKFLSWNAASAGQIEVIEYLEELIDLTKLLVGANEFRSGMLTRPTYREYVDVIGRKPGVENDAGATKDKGERNGVYGDRRDSNLEREREELRDTVSEPRMRRLTRKSTARPQVPPVAKETALHKVKTAESKADDDDLPLSLQRVRSRRIEMNERPEKTANKSREKEQAKHTNRGF